MKRNYKLVLLISAVALLMSLVAVLPALGATGILRFPSPADLDGAQASWVRQGGNVILEVSDSDLDVGTDVTHDLYIECNSGEFVRFDRFTATTSTASGIGFITSTIPVAPPLLDRTGDGLVTFADVTSGSASVSVDSVDSTNGVINLRCNAGLGDRDAATGSDGLTFAVTYKRGAVDKTNTTSTTTGWVKVTSDADPTGIVVRLEETSAASGKFRGWVSVASTASTQTTSTCLVSSCTIGTEVATSSLTTDNLFSAGTWTVGTLKVNPSDTVVMTFVDETTTGSALNRSLSIKIETAAPAVTNQSPADGTAQTNNLPTIKADVTDTDSGVDDTAIEVVWALDTTAPAANGAIDTSVTSPVVSADITALSSGEGYSIEQRFPTISSVATDHIIYWWVEATDLAGNVGVSDRLPIINGAADDCDPAAFVSLTLTSITDITDSGQVAGCQPFSIRIDRTDPSLVDAVTGSWWDASSTADDKTVTDVTLANAEFIRVDFDAPVDGTSVSRTDFEVDNVTPLDAVHYAGRPQSVFLMVPALDPAARPKIEVVDTILDLAGNDLVADVIPSSTDGVAPTLTLAIGSTDRPVTKDSVNITLTSNEAASTATVKIDVGQIRDDSRVVSTTSVPPSGGPTQWTGTIAPGSAGLYNVTAEATDLNATSNTGFVGLAQTPNPVTTTATGVVLFEVDTGVPAPAVLPATETDDPNTFVSWDFANEGLEYGLDSSGVFTVTPASVATGTDFDTYGTVTMLSADLDGTDISADVSTVDNVRLLYKASDLAEGDHTVKIKVVDVAGNEAEFTSTFKVVQRAAFQVPLVPGWNMISFPGAPADPAIDSVIPATVPVIVVMAFDARQGVWLTATRERDAEGNLGPFQGTLTTIDPNLGYWVLTDTFQSISTLIPRLSSGAALGQTPIQPPTIPIVVGWNLVPVLDPTGDLAPGAAVIAPATYFSGLLISRVYSFDTLSGKWVIVDHTSTALVLEVGKSYWVYAREAGTLTP